MLHLARGFATLRVSTYGHYTTGAPARFFATSLTTSAKTKAAAAAATSTRKAKTTQTKKAKTTQAKKTTKKKKKKNSPTKAELKEAKLNKKRALLNPPKQHINSSYTAFLTTYFAKKKARGEDMSIATASTEASQRWRQMSETEKQPYVLMMEESKRDHERVLRDWWQSVDRDLVALENARRRRQNKLAEEQGTGRKLRLLSDPFAPKRPLTAYMLWSNEMRQKSGKISTVNDMAALQKELGARWRNMSESEKKPYYDQFKETQDRYKQQVAKYMSK